MTSPKESIITIISVKNFQNGFKNSDSICSGLKLYHYQPACFQEGSLCIWPYYMMIIVIECNLKQQTLLKYLTYFKILFRKKKMDFMYSSNSYTPIPRNIVNCKEKNVRPSCPGDLGST